MSDMEKFWLKLFNSTLMRNYELSVLIDFIGNIINISKCLTGRSPEFVGSKRLTSRLVHFLEDNDKVKIAPDGIFKDNFLLENPYLEIMYILF